jgi:hypothetical protein
MTFGTARDAGGHVPLTPKAIRAAIKMNAIIRPEHYVLPVKHPANCQCSEHGSKISCRTPSMPIGRETGAHSSMLLRALKPSR